MHTCFCMWVWFSQRHCTAAPLVPQNSKSSIPNETVIGLDWRSCLRLLMLPVMMSGLSSLQPGTISISFLSLSFFAWRAFMQGFFPWCWMIPAGPAVLTHTSSSHLGLGAFHGCQGIIFDLLWLLFILDRIANCIWDYRGLKHHSTDLSFCHVCCPYAVWKKWEEMNQKPQKTIHSSPKQCFEYPSLTVWDM